MSTCVVKIVDDDDCESGLFILACVYDDAFLEILFTCLLKFVDDDDSETLILILTCVYDGDVLSMFLFSDEVLFFTSFLFKSLHIFILRLHSGLVL